MIKPCQFVDDLPWGRGCTVHRAYANNNETVCFVAKELLEKESYDRRNNDGSTDAATR